MMTCSISGVPRMTHTNARESHLSGLNRLMEQNAIGRPSGMAQSSVMRKIRHVTPKPSSSFSVTITKFDISNVPLI